MAPENELTEDCIEFADLIIRQRKKGYRYSLDSILLADFAIREGMKGHILDVGTGAGVIAMIIGRLERDVRKIIAVEIQESLARLAEENVRKNRLTDIIEVVHGDVRKFVKETGVKFDSVVSNPPFRQLGDGRISPDKEKRIARHEYEIDPGDLSRAIALALKSKGACFVIYPARRFLDVSGQFNDGGLRIEKVRMVHSFPDTDGEFALIKGGLGEQKETIVLSPLYIYDRLNAYSDEVKKIYRGLIKK